MEMFFSGMIFGMILDPFIMLILALFWLYPQEKGGKKP